jgi:hypothetical protein
MLRICRATSIAEEQNLSAIAQAVREDRCGFCDTLLVLLERIAL